MEQSAHGETILLVDNDPIIRDLIARMLNHQGYAVLDARNGEEALATAAQYPDPIHLLVTDAKMPGMGGFRLADQFAVARPAMRALYITGHYDHDAAIRQGLHQSQQLFLLKPFRQDELAKAIREVLDRPTQQERDAFALILASPRVAAEPMRDTLPLQGIPRALRFRVRLSLRYRAAREFDWHDGVTENLSQSVGRAVSDHLPVGAENARRDVPDPAYGRGRGFGSAVALPGGNRAGSAARDRGYAAAGGGRGGDIRSGSRVRRSFLGKRSPHELFAEPMRTRWRPSRRGCDDSLRPASGTAVHPRGSRALPCRR